MKLEPVIWIGKIKGQWPLYAWEDQESAEYWAAKDPAEREICSVAVPPDSVVYRTELVPATTRLVQVSP